MRDTAPTPHRTIIREKTVLRRAGDPHSTTLHRWEQKGLFPRRIVIGPNMIGWYEDEIDAWVEARQRQQDSGRPSPNPKAHRVEAHEPG